MFYMFAEALHVLCNCDYTLLPSSEDFSCSQWISAVMDESVLHCDLNDSIGHSAGVACRGHGHCNSACPAVRNMSSRQRTVQHSR